MKLPFLRENTLPRTEFVPHEIDQEDPKWRTFDAVEVATGGIIRTIRLSRGSMFSNRPRPVPVICE